MKPASILQYNQTIIANIIHCLAYALLYFSLPLYILQQSLILSMLGQKKNGRIQSINMKPTKQTQQPSNNSEEMQKK